MTFCISLLESRLYCQPPDRKGPRDCRQRNKQWHQYPTGGKSRLREPEVDHWFRWLHCQPAKRKGGGHFWLRNRQWHQHLSMGEDWRMEPEVDSWQRWLHYQSADREGGGHRWFGNCARNEHLPMGEDWCLEPKVGIRRVAQSTTKSTMNRNRCNSEYFIVKWLYLLLDD